MIIYVLVFGMSLTLSGSGKLDAGAQVEAVFKTEQECKTVKAKLDQNSKDAVAKGQVEAQINSFGATCVPVVLDIHNKRPTTGA